MWTISGPLKRNSPTSSSTCVVRACGGDNWNEKKDVNDEGDGFLGFVHNAVIDHHLKDHEAPEDIEFYFCGPPMMNQAVLKMCDDWGVPPEIVSFDVVGG